jgi:hypothetical protein
MLWIGIAQGLITAFIGVILLRGGKGARRIFGYVLILLGLVIAIGGGMLRPKS